MIKLKNIILIIILKYLIIINISCQTIVYEDILDLCYWQDKSIYKSSKKCEKINDLIVEKRINGETRPYWCIVINNRRRTYRQIEIQFNGTQNSRQVSYYVRNIERLELNNANSFIEKFKIKATMGRIVINSIEKSNFQNIISLKIDNIEMCNNDTREYPLSPEPSNINKNWFVDQCKDMLEREYTEPTNCEKVKEVTLEEFSMNDNINFWCVIVVQNSQGKLTSSTGIDELEFVFSNENFEITSVN